MVDVEPAWNRGIRCTSTAQAITYDSKGKVTNAFSFTPGAAGDIVVVKVLYNWPVFGPAGLGLSNQPNGDHLLAVAVFKNATVPRVTSRFSPHLLLIAGSPTTAASPPSSSR